MKETIGDRLVKVIKHYNMTVNSFSNKLGLSGNTVIGRIVNDPDRAPSFALLQKITTNFPEINTRWVITGKGDMLSNDADRQYIYYYQLESTSQMLDAIDGRMNSTAIMCVYGFRDNSFAFDIVGDSMSPRFNPGSIFICEKVAIDQVVNGAAYLIICKDIQLVRYIRSINSDGTLTLAAENPRYPENNIQTSKIIYLLAIRGTITREVY